MICSIICISRTASVALLSIIVLPLMPFLLGFFHRFLFYPVLNGSIASFCPWFFLCPIYSFHMPGFYNQPTMIDSYLIRYTLPLLELETLYMLTCCLTAWLPAASSSPAYPGWAHHLQPHYWLSLSSHPLAFPSLTSYQNPGSILIRLLLLSGLHINSHLRFLSKQKFLLL